jgi:imidazolonepropionase-like amidohydrolase
MTTITITRGMTMNKRTIKSLIALLPMLIVSVLLAEHSSAQLPGKKQDKTVAIVDATIYPVTSASIENGVLLVENGIIKAVGAEVTIPQDAIQISAKGKSIYPGFIESHSQLGLTEIAAVRATRDFREPGMFNPNVKSFVSINMENVILPVTRTGGVLVALSAPSGGLISGQSSIVQLDGWTYEDMVLSPVAAVQVNWPLQRLPARTIARLDKEKLAEEKEELKEQQEKLFEFFELAKAYHEGRSQADSQTAFDSKLEAMRDVVAGRVPMMVRADQSAEIQSAVSFAARENLKIILLGGYDAVKCAELLKSNNVPVIVSATHRLPLRRDDRHDDSYTLPARLKNAGVKFCISSTDRSETWNTRNLPFHAAVAQAYGLDRNSALRSVTIDAAEILGIADRVGSLEAGKDATFIVVNGDPLEAVSTIDRAWVAGREIDLSNRQTRLYEKYREKYRRVDANEK